MFGLGFGEMVVLGIVLLVVVGPRELPKLLRSVGKGLNKLRRMSTDLREQSGIDEIIKDEGLREDLDTLRQLSRGRSGLVDGLMKPDAARRPRPRPRPRALAPALDDLTMPDGEPPDPDAEYPLAGPDAYGSDETPDDEPSGADDEPSGADDEPSGADDEPSGADDDEAVDDDEKAEAS